MNKKWTTPLIIIIILTFIGYIVYDLALRKEKTPVSSVLPDSTAIPDSWYVSNVFDPGLGKLKAVTVSGKNNFILGGESFVSKFDSDLKPVWTLKTAKPVTAVSESGDSIFATTSETILVISSNGKLITEWGPFEDSAVIASVSANITMVAFSDAQNKIVTLLDKKGNVKKQIGTSGEPFIIPSFYFEVELTSDNLLYIANTGKSRVEIRNTDGSMVSTFGQPGIGPAEFCGCCNPAHFTIIPDGFITAEKGINRIKILNKKGEFVEFVSSVNKFLPPLPLDVASPDGKIIYAANPADSKLYIFKRKV
jgi:hypothetical protein